MPRLTDQGHINFASAIAIGTAQTLNSRAFAEWQTTTTDAESVSRYFVKGRGSIGGSTYRPKDRKEVADGRASPARFRCRTVAARPVCPGLRQAVPHAHPPPTLARVPSGAAVATRPQQNPDRPGGARADRPAPTGPRPPTQVLLLGS